MNATTNILSLLLALVLSLNMVLSPVDASAVESGGVVNQAADVLPNQDVVQDALNGGLSNRDMIASQVVAEQFTHHISNVEWLAPLAPVALSPFFGIALLSGMACYGPEWMQSNALLSAGSPLANPTFFWVFLALTILTSLPRFSKVSKPIAQLADFLETYAAIVILAVLKFSSIAGPETESIAQLTTEQAGILSFGWEGLVVIAMAINIIVINAVKFFFEILVWITPIPFLDACFEAANKSLCAGLMAIYAINPMIALFFNLILFVLSALVFVWIKRREIFYRTILVDWLLNRISKVKQPAADRLIVFPKSEIGAIPTRAKCWFEKNEIGWTLTHHRMLRGPLVEHIEGTARIRTGWWTNTIVFEDNRRLTFSTRCNGRLEALASNLELNWMDQQSDIDQQTSRQIEFA